MSFFAELARLYVIFRLLLYSFRNLHSRKLVSKNEGKNRPTSKFKQGVASYNDTINLARNDKTDKYNAKSLSIDEDENGPLLNQRMEETVRYRNQLNVEIPSEDMIRDDQEKNISMEKEITNPGGNDYLITDSELSILATYIILFIINTTFCGPESFHFGTKSTKSLA